MSSKKKKNRRKKKKVPTTTMQVNSERNGNRLWRIVMDHPNIFDTHIVTKLNGNDVKFFYDVNTESRAAIKRSGVQLRNAFKIGDFDTPSTISWALTNCSEKKERFFAQMARNGNVELLKFLHEKGCPWNEWTCFEAAQYGHLECLKYAHKNGCPCDGRTCFLAARGGHLEFLKYLHEHGCPWDEGTCLGAAHGRLDCLKYAREKGCPWDEVTCSAAQKGMSLE